MKYLFFVYQWLIAVPILAVLTIITALTVSIGSLFGSPDFWGYWPPHYWSRCVCVLLGVRVKVIGRENIDPKTSYVFVANHQGAFDIWAIYGYLNHNFKWMMKKELEKVPFIGMACKSARHIFVDDASLASIKETIEKSQEVLREGMSLVIFPEGSRTWDGKMIPFKRGAFMLAGEFRLPVVPITIDGSFEAMPRNTYNATPHKLIMTIHKPIYPTERGFNTKALMAQCREEINSALPAKHKDPVLKTIAIALVVGLASLFTPMAFAQSQSREQQMQEARLPQTTILGDQYYYYTAKKGDSVYGICYMFGWDEQTLRKLNPEATGSLKKDQRVYYPVSKENVAKKADAQSAQEVPSQKPIEHLVKKGETVYSISRLYNIPVEKIYDAHPSARQGIKAGETITILPSDGTADMIYYTVQPGDTLFKLAREYNTTVEEILRLNPGVSERNFRSGSIVRINPSSAAKNTTTETVEQTELQSVDSYKTKKNDTWSSIARENDITVEELMEANPDVKKLKKNTTIVIPEMGTVEVQRTVEAVDPREQTSEGLQEIYEEVNGLVADSVATHPSVKVAILLDKAAAKRDLDFVRGFLLAVNDLKNPNYDIKLNVQELAQLSEEELDKLLDETDFVVATHESIPQSLTKAGEKHKVPVISVFDVKNRDFIDNPYMIQMLPQSSYFNAAVAARIFNDFGNRKTIVVGNGKDELFDEVIASLPNGALNLSLEEFGEYELTPGTDYLVLGNVSKKDEVLKLVDAIASKTTDTLVDVATVGRPNWIVYAENNESRFGKANVMIPSRFYFDNTSARGASFLSSYRDAFDHDPVKSFPLYAASGYDTANYMIPNVADKGADINAIIAAPLYLSRLPLQADTDLQRVSLWGGIVNKTVYLLRFMPGGVVDQIVLQP